MQRHFKGMKMFKEADKRLVRLIEDGPESNEHYRLLHLHIPKTAGVSFLALFKRRFQDNLHLPWNAGGPTWKKKVQTEPVPRFTTGHIRFREVFFGPIVASKPLLIMSVVRDPLDRAISDYNYMRSVKHPPHEQFFAANPDVNTYIRARTEQKNIQATWLSGSNVDIEAVKGAVSRHYVGLAPMTRLDQYVDHLQRAFLPGTPEAIEHRNELQKIVHGEKVSVRDVAPDVLDMFNAANDLDRRIYDEALECWDRYLGAASSNI